MDSRKPDIFIQGNSQFDTSISMDESDNDLRNTDGEDSFGYRRPPDSGNFQTSGESFLKQPSSIQPSSPTNFSRFTQQFSSNTPEQYSPRPGQDLSDDINTGSPELVKIFGLISQFTPPAVEIQPNFRPFLPDLSPAIGAIDAFIKVPRPDGQLDQLGLTVLDEPTIACSNPQILKMQLRERFGVVSQNDQGDGYISYIENPRENHKAPFFESYDEILRNRAPPSISYTYTMPDLEDLMEPWPEKFETTLNSLPLPTADLDLSLEEYAKIICALLEIPVKNNIIESLHVLFSVYMQFKENTHFGNDSSIGTPIKGRSTDTGFSGSSGPSTKPMMQFLADGVQMLKL